MTSHPADPKTLESWEDAFQYPLPVVRKLEQQLRRHIDDNRQKLRSLVGTSYRDLLGTAERIIDMDGQIQLVESNMADIGRRCNTRRLEKIGDNHKSVRRERGREEDVRFGRLAQTKILQNALNMISRAVKSGGDALLAVKIFLLARLLLKGIAEGDDPPAALDSLKKRLQSAKKRLSSYIARKLTQTKLEKASTVYTLCAYSLLTGCAPKEVLRYFLQVRLEQLELMAEKSTEKALLGMLALYSQTLLDAKELFPRRFADSLSKISTTTLARDPDVQAVYELNLDIYARWIAEDVRTFHPWVPHDELSTASVSAATASWAKQAQECLLQTLKEALATQQDVIGVLQLRQKVIKNYLVLSSRLRSKTQAQSLDDLREAFLERLEALGEQAATVAGFIPNTRQHDADTGPSSIWEIPLRELDLARGSAQFRDVILKRHHGRNILTDESSSALDLWLSRLRTFGDAIVTMRGTKWDDDLDLDLDDLTDDEPLQVVLSRKDPQRLEQKLQQATKTSLQGVYTTLKKSFDTDTDPALLIRVLREVDDRRRTLAQDVGNLDTITSSHAFVASLHQRLAISTIAEPLQVYVTRLKTPAHVAFTLWDGMPPLPVQPSPTMYRFLKSLQHHMSNVGKDLWSAKAVQTLKTHLADSLDDKTMLAQIDQSLGVQLTNGHANADPSEDKVETEASKKDAQKRSRHRLIQHFFDVRYLQRVLLSDQSGSSQLEAVADKLKARVDLDSEACERMEKSAEDYWRRTHLLFGLLATGQAS